MDQLDEIVEVVPLSHKQGRSNQHQHAKSHCHQQSKSNCQYMINDTLVSSYVAGLVGVFVGFPLDTLKTRMQTHNFHSLKSCVVDTFTHEGVKGFYRGLIPPLLTTSIIKSGAFTIYEASKTYYAANVMPAIDQPSLTHCFMGGVTGGVAISLVSSPFELVKTQMMTNRLLERHAIASSSLTPSLAMSSHTTPWLSIRYHMPPVAEQAVRRYANSLDCLTTILRERGPTILYRGYAPQMLREGLGFGTYFTAYEALCSSGSHTGKKRDAGLALNFFAGGLSGMFIWLIIFPFDFVKARLQRDAHLDKPQYRGMFDCVSRTYASGGLAAFYRGIQPSMIRAFPVHATIFVVYESCLRLLR